MKFRHWIIFVSITALMILAFQPLAAAIVVFAPVYFSYSIGANSTSQLGLVQGLYPYQNNTNLFASAATLTKASVIYKMGRPPFIWNTWVVSNYEIEPYPKPYVSDGSVSIAAIGINTIVQCANPASVSWSTNDSGNHSLTATSKDNCTQNVTFDVGQQSEMYGVINVPNCGRKRQSIVLEPVMFWFFVSQPPNMTGTAAAVFCEPHIDVSVVEVVTDSAYNVYFEVIDFIHDHLKYHRIPLQSATAGIQHVTSNPNATLPDNKVTGPPLNGDAFNG